MWFYFLIFFILVLFCYINFKQKKTILWGIVFLLILVAANGSQLSVDYKGYKLLYNEVLTGYYRVELSFVLISGIAHSLFNSPIAIFIIYAILGVSLKILGIKRLTELWFFSILIYFSYYFLLHEMVQIRAGVSAAFILLSIPAIYEKNKKLFFLYACAAIFFHYSALILLPFYFLKKDKIEQWFYFLIPVGFLMFFCKINVASLVHFINIDFINLKYQFYVNRQNIDQINIFNSVAVVRYAFCGILLWKWTLLKEKNPYSIILIKFYILSSFAYIVLADIPVFGVRVSQLLGVVEIILIPMIIYLIKQKWIGKVLVVIVGLMFLSLALLFEKIVKGYF